MKIGCGPCSLRCWPKEARRRWSLVRSALLVPLLIPAVILRSSGAYTSAAAAPAAAAATAATAATATTAAVAAVVAGAAASDLRLVNVSITVLVLIVTARKGRL